MTLGVDNKGAPIQIPKVVGVFPPVKASTVCGAWAPNIKDS